MGDKIVAFFLCCFFSLSVKGGEGEYAVAKIPAALLKNSNMVIRLENESVELHSLTKLLLKRHFVITVLNEKGAKFARLVEFYDKFSEIKSIEGTLYDASGNKIKSLKSKDIEDFSGSSDNLADDNRYKMHNFYFKVYPYTVEYSIEEEKKETMFFPSWTPVWDEYVSVEKSSLSIKDPKD